MTVETVTLSSFLLARIAEDEAIASESRPNEHTRRYDTPGFTVESADSYSRIVVSSGRVLAECEAKRRIVGNLIKCERMQERGHVTDFAQGELMAYRAATQSLALPYADHPDYRKEWRP